MAAGNRKALHRGELMRTCGAHNTSDNELRKSLSSSRLGSTPLNIGYRFLIRQDQR